MSEVIKKVLYNVDQTNDVTSAEQAQARANIGAIAASDVVGKTVYVNWDGTSDKFADIEAIVAAGNVPVVRYDNYDYVCVDSQNDGRFVFMGELGEGGVFAFIQFFRGGTPPSYRVVPLALPSRTSTDVGKVLGLVQGTTNAEPAWVSPSGSDLPIYTTSDANKSLVVNADGDGVEWDYRLKGRFVEDDGQGSTTSYNVRTLTINMNDMNKGMVRMWPDGRSVVICGRLAPEFGINDANKILAVDANAEDLVWANPPYVKHDPLRLSSFGWMNPYTEEYTIFGGEMTFKMEWAANDHGLGPSAMTPYLKGKVTTASGWTANIHVSKGASGGMSYQETSIVHGTSNDTYVDLSQCDYGNGFKVTADLYPMIVNMDIQYVNGLNSYSIGHLTWMKTNTWVFLRTTYDG